MYANWLQVHFVGLILKNRNVLQSSEKQFSMFLNLCKLNKYNACGRSGGVGWGEGTVLLGVNNEQVLFCVKIPLVYQEFCISCRCGSTVVKTSIHTIRNLYSLLAVFKKCVRVSACAQSFKLLTSLNIWFCTLCSAVIIHFHASYRFLSFCILVKHLAFSSFPEIVILCAYSIA